MHLEDEDGVRTQAETRREKAKYFKGMAEKVLEERGLSQLCFKLFIHDIMLHANKGVTAWI